MYSKIIYIYNQRCFNNLNDIYKLNNIYKAN